MLSYAPGRFLQAVPHHPATASSSCTHDTKLAAAAGHLTLVGVLVEGKEDEMRNQPCRGIATFGLLQQGTRTEPDTRSSFMKDRPFVASSLLFQRTPRRTSPIALICHDQPAAVNARPSDGPVHHKARSHSGGERQVASFVLLSAPGSKGALNTRSAVRRPIFLL